ncbi:MAG: hypothetical protein RBS72_02190 [Sedimentisphaerales bacterium]|nr:hypothetical protein [Sedimentisphaerales bacterium]HNY77346.1 hypothetical protein [Sedimentisphaerales bacterium]HOC62051.1 hypothetical protein [Sedimentisphaerales bacterium]HOH63562.1 hypothetical protein [Sedimentisphaerales bacterium]HPY48522.1 hypothetical protein [Sedimentisphaerales bacterium]
MAKTAMRAVVIMLLGSLLSGGCSREDRVLAGRTDRIVRTTSDWGPQAEGLQCRLRPTKRLWQSAETPTFRLDLRNQSRRLFAFDVHEPICPDRVWLDGRWYQRRRDEAARAKMYPLAPGGELADLMLTVPTEMGLPLGPGRHTIQVAFDLEDITVVSNPVEIEVTAAPAGSSASSGHCTLGRPLG